jgi:hypothetical protein
LSADILSEVPRAKKSHTWENLQKIITQIMKKEKCETYIKMYVGGTDCTVVHNSKFVRGGEEDF